MRGDGVRIGLTTAEDVSSSEDEDGAPEDAAIEPDFGLDGRVTA